MKRMGNSLAQSFPNIASDWDYDRNENLTPSDVTAHANKHVWWKCTKCGESWIAKVSARTGVNKTGCSYCAGKQVSSARSLGALYPEIAVHWDAEKNETLKPDQVLPQSNRKVWWICPHGHSYRSNIASRVRGRGCPICSGNIVIEATSLAAKFPALVEQWHPDKNLPLTPVEVTPHSGKKVWWKCPSGHEWEAQILNRSSANSGCPYCSGQLVSPDKSLLAVNPELAAEWHPTRNHDRTPDQFLPYSGFKPWWRCPRGHEWPAAIRHRQNGSGCPFCGGGTSALEARVFTELKALFSDVVWHSSSMGVQVDVLLPTFGLGIEIDGHYWHSEKIEADLRKNATCKNHGVKVIRLRQSPLKKLSSWDIEYLRSDTDLSVIQRLVSAISAGVDDDHVCKVADDYLSTNQLSADAAYRKIIANLPSPPDGASFASIYPDVAAEWHEDRNAPLEPSMFAPKANRIVWWRCKKKGHEWQAAIHTRATGVGCPYCSNKKIGSDNNLAVTRPDLILEWNFERNSLIRPTEIAPKSNKKVWWKCLKLGHEWKATVGNRANGSGCPYCAGRISDSNNSFMALYPEIASTWDDEKNAPLRPDEIRSQSSRKVWWKCSICETSWQSDVQHRVIAKIGCPKCSRQIAGEQMRKTRLKSFGTLRQKAPELAMKWHPNRNADLTPDNVGRNSTKPVWWLCLDCSHEWFVSPHYYRKCPLCGKK